jgi:hypothetical protein
MPTPELIELPVVDDRAPEEPMIDEANPVEEEIIEGPDADTPTEDPSPAVP